MKSLRHRDSGFTLMELVVVCVIVAVLIALFLPAFLPKVDPPPHQRAPCQINLKQIGLGCAQYAEDFSGPGCLPCGGTSVFADMQMMSNYLGSAKVLVCPSGAKKPAANFNVPHPTDAEFVGYSYQVSGLNHSATGMIWQADPNDVIMWDQGVLGNPGGPSGIGLPWSPTSNHKGAGGNVLFNDGHVAWKTKTPTNMTLGCQNP